MMLRIISLTILFLVITPSIAADDASYAYRLDKGDQFEVYVLNEEDLSVTVKVNDKGTIFYPLLGEISVAGKTPGEVEADITRRLKGPYLVDPLVSVTMETYREFFIGGAVKKPGWYEYDPGMNFQQAVDLAGGFTDMASRRRIYVQEPNSGKDDRRKVTLDYKITPNDSLFVDESFF